MPNVYSPAIDDASASAHWFDGVHGMTNLTRTPVMRTEWVRNRILKSGARYITNHHGARSEGLLPIDKFRVVEFLTRETPDSQGNVFFLTMFYSERHVCAIAGRFDVRANRMIWECYAD